MHFSPAVIAVCLSLAASNLVGQEPAMTSVDEVYPDLPTVSEVVEYDDVRLRPDYSAEALLSAIWTDPYFDEEVPRAPETFNPLQFTVFGQTFRFMPFLGSSGGVASSAIPFAAVDPFSVAPVSAAYTPRTFRDRWFEWRMRKKIAKKEKEKGDE